MQYKTIQYNAMQWKTIQYDFDVGTGKKWIQMAKNGPLKENRKLDLNQTLAGQEMP